MGHGGAGAHGRKDGYRSGPACCSMTPCVGDRPHLGTVSRVRGAARVLRESSLPLGDPHRARGGFDGARPSSRPFASRMRQASSAAGVPGCGPAWDVHGAIVRYWEPSPPAHGCAMPLGPARPPLRAGMTPGQVVAGPVLDAGRDFALRMLDVVAPAGKFANARHNFAGSSHHVADSGGMVTSRF